MLQLTLNPGEYVVIGDNVKVSYERLSSNRQLVLSFDAPREVQIMRQQIHEEMLIEEAGADSFEGRRLAAQFQEAREERERAAMARAERAKERNRIKRESRGLRKEAREVHAREISRENSNKSLRIASSN